MMDSNYVRPSQVRTIPLKASSYRGEIITTKLCLREENSIISFPYESGLERDFLINLDHDRYCCDIVPQPAKVPWTDKDGKERVAYPDCWAAFITGKQVLFQVKPFERLQELEKDEDWRLEKTAIGRYCQDRGWELKIVDERHIRTPRFNNIMLFRGAAQHPPETSQVDRVKEVLPYLDRKRIGIAFPGLVRQVTENMGVTDASIEYIIKYLLYHQLLYFNWNQPFTKKTPIFLNFDLDSLAEHFYKIVPVSHKNTSTITKPVKVDMDLLSLSPEQISEADERFEAIRPLLENLNRTKADVIRRAGEVGKGYVALYRWTDSYVKEGWRGLVTKDFEKGNRQKRLRDEVEQIVQREIDDYEKGQISNFSCCKRIRLECKKVGFPPPSDKAIRLRIKNRPAKERLGKQGGFIRNQISQSVMGELPAGTEPRQHVMCDHCRLDIVLQDQVYRKPTDRPWLTLLLDTYSRMIYGYFLSFDSPSSLSVTAALLTAILPKEELLNKFGIDAPYPIHGLPKRIQVDNSKEFMSEHLKLFCKSYNIDLEFRPVRRPDRGGYIERLFGTINRKIRDDGLKGYAPPLKNRPENYDPEKDAEKGGMTLPEFEKWFLNVILKEYHLKPHEGLGMSPLERYQSGVFGLDQALASQPVVPADLEKLKFDILPISYGEYRLNSYGIQWQKNRYNSKELANIRKKNQGKPKKFRFRYDPSDIRQIHVCDTDYHSLQSHLYPAQIKSGNLAQFVYNNPNTPVSLSEAKKINQILKENGRPITPFTVESALAERIELRDEFAENNRRARKEIERKKRHPVVSVKPYNFNENEILEGIEEDEGNLLPPLPENIVKTYAVGVEKEDELLPTPQESLPRMKKKEGW